MTIHKNLWEKLQWIIAQKTTGNEQWANVKREGIEFYPSFLKAPGQFQNDGGIISIFGKAMKEHRPFFKKNMFKAKH